LNIKQGKNKEKKDIYELQTLCYENGYYFVGRTVHDASGSIKEVFVLPPV